MQLTDLDKVMKINLDSFAYPWPKKEFKKWLSESLVAQEKEIEGFVVGNASKDRGILRLIAVDKASRQKGLGKDLVNALEKRLKQKGAKEISAHSRLSNPKAISFLESCGFKEAKTENDYYKNGESARLMKKKI